MKLDQFCDLVNWINSLSDKQFQTLRALVLINTGRRKWTRRSPPKSPPRGELEDCDPGSKRQGAAPKSL